MEVSNIELMVSDIDWDIVLDKEVILVIRSVKLRL
jgi:hypothetical protein